MIPIVLYNAVSICTCYLYMECGRIGDGWSIGCLDDMGYVLLTI